MNKSGQTISLSFPYGSRFRTWWMNDEKNKINVKENPSKTKLAREEGALEIGGGWRNNLKLRSLKPERLKTSLWPQLSKSKRCHELDIVQLDMEISNGSYTDHQRSIWHDFCQKRGANRYKISSDFMNNFEKFISPVTLIGKENKTFKGTTRFGENLELKLVSKLE
ncbi:hypothetical protein TNCV_4495001 [Trichonephila clavipes]|nr:hypothetical protein TNCV_4495001 [Trichonephila clavipes]